MNKVKRCKAVMSAAVLAMSVSAGHSQSAMERQRAGVSQFETGSNMRELMDVRSREMKELARQAPEPQKAAEGFVDTATQARAAIARALETSGVDNSSKITKLDVSPTPLGTVYTFQAIVRVTGFAGPSFAQEYKVIGAYNILTKEVTVAGRELIGSGKPAAQRPAADPNAARELVKSELESGFLGVSAYAVVTGIQVEQTPRQGVFEFKAHKKIVGHGWEERYSVTGTCDLNTGKVEHQSKMIWGNRPPFFLNR